MTNDKLKDAVEEEVLELDTDEEDVKVDSAWYPREKRVIQIEMKQPTLNSQLFSIEQIIDSSLAILMARKEQGELNKQDWKRLNDLVEMKFKLSKLDLVTKQTSILEGKTDQEIIELVEAARDSLENENEED